jgi:hypothetical protein
LSSSWATSHLYAQMNSASRKSIDSRGTDGFSMNFACLKDVNALLPVHLFTCAVAVKGPWVALAAEPWRAVGVDVAAPDQLRFQPHLPLMQRIRSLLNCFSEHEVRLVLHQVATHLHQALSLVCDCHQTHIQLSQALFSVP